MIIDSFKGDWAFLSNFYMSPITLGGRRYPSVEHYFQAMKNTNIDYRDKVAAAETPSDAKRLGRAVVLREDWDQNKEIYMARGLRVKFGRHTDLARRLVETHPIYLLEGNTWGDRYWGAVRSEETGRWEGKNRLGKLLMLRREDLM